MQKKQRKVYLQRIIGLLCMAKMVKEINAAFVYSLDHPVLPLLLSQHFYPVYPARKHLVFN